MQSSFSCPVCSAERWEDLGTYRYGASEHLESGVLDDYRRLRRRVLFEVWFPGEDEVVLRARLCLTCGFVAYAPRPDERDVDAKYRFLQKTEKDIGASASSPRGRRRDRLRAQRLHRSVDHALARPPRRVLDFGGGDGKLLTPFVELGANCLLVDYNVRPLPGVTKVGNTLDDLPPAARFETIVCSHVLEHLADPGNTVARLRDHLEGDGVLYAEVPAEVWKGIPIWAEPVTHVNFFTLSSFHRLFASHGLRVLEARREMGYYGENRLEVLVVLAARGSAGEEPPDGEPAEATRRLLHPSMGMELARAWRARRAPSASGILRRLSRSRRT